MDLEPSVVEQFERKFTLDQESRGLSLADLQRHGSSSSIQKRQHLQAPINVYFHVISADDTPGNGNIRGSQVTDQITELNTAFRRAGLRFSLAGFDRTVNADWFNNGGPDTSQQDAMKRALRRGNATDLNIYTVNFQGVWAGLLGYATFPQSYDSAPLDDGIVITHKALPDGALTSYSQGKTAVHETGHWVGLYHTFQGSCFEPGDYVYDTQPEALPSEGCQEGKTTCLLSGVLEGQVDPIHNYMDYSPDACMNEFTPGQADRARLQLMFYRGIDFH